MDIHAFLARCDATVASTGISRSRLSTIIFGSGVTIDRLHDGAGVTVRVLDRAAHRLDAWEQERSEKGRLAA
jgi:hypothetical protein